jgi:hypothetical protein
MTRLWIECLVSNWSLLAEMGPIRRGALGAKTVQVNNVMRVLVTLLKNKRGMSAFAQSGHLYWHFDLLLRLYCRSAFLSG